MAEFELSNSNIEFTPLIYPGDVNVKKERRKSRQDGFCDGEEITDIGSKNREIKITGVFFASEKATFDRLLDEGEPLDLIAEEHRGKVEVLSGEYRRDGLDTYKYKLDLVSTGLDEGTSPRNSGIISRGRDGDNTSTLESGQTLYTETFIPQVSLRDF